MNVWILQTFADESILSEHDSYLCAQNVYICIHIFFCYWKHNTLTKLAFCYYFIFFYYTFYDILIFWSQFERDL